MGQCLFWRHDSEQAGTEDECLFLKTDYHQDCKSIASPIDGDLTACSNVDQFSCDSILPENCDYTGDRLTDIEPGPVTPEVSMSVLSMPPSLQTLESSILL